MCVYMRVKSFSEAKTVKLIANETIQYITSPNYPMHYGK